MVPLWGSLTLKSTTGLYSYQKNTQPPFSPPVEDNHEVYLRTGVILERYVISLELFSGLVLLVFLVDDLGSGAQSRYPGSLCFTNTRRHRGTAVLCKSVCWGRTQTFLTKHCATKKCTDVLYLLFDFQLTCLTRISLVERGTRKFCSFSYNSIYVPVVSVSPRRGNFRAKFDL